MFWAENSTLISNINPENLGDCPNLGRDHRLKYVILFDILDQEFNYISRS